MNDEHTSHYTDPLAHKTRESSLEGGRDSSGEGNQKLERHRKHPHPLSSRQPEVNALATSRCRSDEKAENVAQEPQRNAKATRL